MKKLTLILALVGGFSLTSSALTYPGKRCGTSTVGGILVICCTGSSGTCFGVVIKPNKIEDNTAYVITTYNNGDVNSVDGEYNVSDISTSDPDSDGNTITNATLLP